MNKVILASGSPRRKELFETLNIPFDIKVSNVDESLDANLSICENIEALSFRKALAVFKENKDSVVIGSDTVVVINGEVLGKPKNEENASVMLHKLSNKTHQVITAVSIISATKSETYSIVSDVTFNQMSDEEIIDYINTKEPFDKAGGYAIQGYGARFIKEIKGDYYAIVGLPVSSLYQRIQKYL